MTNSAFFVFTFGFLGFFTNTITAQLDTKNENLYKTFDSIVGEEVSGLYNGVQYNNEFIVLEEKHQFFGANEFIKGYVQYDGQNYYDISLKYDLLNDHVIVSPKNASGSLTFRLINSKVNRFVINDRLFVNTTKNNLDSTENIGFCEVLLSKDIFSLYKKYIKKGSEKSKNSKVFFEFNLKESYYLNYGDNFLPVNTRSELILIFPDRKNVIKDYFKSYRNLLKSDHDTFLELLLKRLYEINESNTI
ncbi:hypothetical protein LV716_16265 [Flagellimonas sp. HMM57]|uniref:hypothetical protein n=1 Tax=unclassified Flagellimonas TaxID=2644544 RepID=UPI0013D0A6EA|nr:MULTISPECIES: hypothetical protein [unclassified Flagellimonas]UII75797.1 hypothetical protein LV716_16265 [Flagellimonas sp. HMM57]